MNSDRRFLNASAWRWFVALVPLALVAALGAVALRTTIVTRDVRGSLEFIVVGPPVRELAMTLAVSVAGILLLHALLLRQAAGWPEPAATVRSGAYASPLLIFLLPIAGVAVAMWGGAAAPPLVYWCWEMAPWWCAIAVALTIGNALVVSGTSWSAIRDRVRRVSPRMAYLWLGAVVAAWIVVSNPSLRTWRWPLGDEPRYLRYVESWCQGGGVDISRVARLSEVSRDGGPHLFQALWFGVRALAADARGLVSDVVASLTESDFRWDRMTSGDGSFVMGRGGGSYQSHQPGLSLLLLPGYAVDRHMFSKATVYDGQFPERLPMVHATLTLIAAAGAIALAALCRNIGVGMAGASAFAFLAWASFPASAMALQVYPETCAALMITAALALLTGRSDSRRAIAIAGVCAGYPLFLHVRFVLVSVVLFLFGAWTLRQSRRRAVVFAIAWAVPVAAQLWFVYHATGIPWPTAFYRTADQSVVRASVVPSNVLRFVADRDWGFLPYAPMLLVALAGFVSLWRLRKDLALAIAGVALALTATAATHNVAAGGGTPTRLITGMVPLLIVPAAAAVREWGDRSALRLLFAALALLTLDQAWDYNRTHVKEVGAFISPGVSGWRINLVFPYLTEGFTRQPLLAVAGVAVSVLMLLLTTVEPWARRARSAGGGSIAAAALVAVAIAITASGTWAHWHPRFRHNEEQGRAALVDAYVKAGDCSLCWSSRRGPLGAQDLAANALESLALDAQATGGRQARFHVSASGPNGPVFGTVRFDFGDGQVSAPRVMAGTLDINHVYRDAGEYKAKAWLYLPGESARMATATVRVVSGTR
jgi:PKD domain